jgi:hypothetical protein
MASLGGFGAVTGGSSLSGGTSAPGRDFLDLESLITTDGSLETFDVAMDGNQPGGETLKLKIWRLNGASYDFIGQSQAFSSLVAGVNTGLTLTTPIDVLTGDIISIQLSNSSTNKIFTAANVGNGIDFKTGDDTTSQATSSYSPLADLSIAVEVFGTPTAGDLINITSINDHECKQRDGSSQATFTVAGTITGTATTVEYQLDAGAWTLLDAAPTTTFTGNVTVTNQQDISVRFSNNTGITDTVTKITAAACIAAWGQSNEAGRGTNNQTVTVGGGNPTPIMYKSGVFSALGDPVGTDGSAAGSTWPEIAQQYSDAGIPICVGNVAVGATLLAAWQPATVNYIKITDFADAVGGLEFSTCVIGEQDSFAGTLQATVESEMNAIVNALFTAYGSDNYIADIPEGDGGVWDDTVVKAAYANVISSNANAKFGGDLSVIDIDIATTPGNDGIHLKSDADLTTAANIRYAAINGSTLNLTIAGIPDGTYMTVLDKADGTRIQRQNETYASTSLSTFLGNVPVGTTVKGYVDDAANPSTNGAYLEGVTT